jgi:hypothetical protein
VHVDGRRRSGKALFNTKARDLPVNHPWSVIVETPKLALQGIRRPERSELPGGSGGLAPQEETHTNVTPGRRPFGTKRLYLSMVFFLGGPYEGDKCYEESNSAHREPV